jgi:hypothetical protein
VVLNLRAAHSYAVQECGISDPRLFLSRWPIAICPFFARGVFRMEEKPAPFTKTVKSAAPGNSTYTQTLAYPPFESAIPDTIYTAEKILARIDQHPALNPKLAQMMI